MQQELGAVMNQFDKDEDGTVDVVEFTKMFFKMGFEERTKRTKERRDAEAVRTGGGAGGGVLICRGRGEAEIPPFAYLA